jgi:hypothetical protein
MNTNLSMVVYMPYPAAPPTAIRSPKDDDVYLKKNYLKKKKGVTKCIILHKNADHPKA